jgi:glutamate synthase (NADPH/NADH) large chain
MTGGTVVVLGPVGRNFAAGMSGGIAYLYDTDGASARRVNRDMVDVEPVEDWTALHALVAQHAALTGSRQAQTLLASWAELAPLFVQVMPHDLRRVMAEAERDPDLAIVHG